MRQRIIKFYLMIVVGIFVTGLLTGCSILSINCSGMKYLSLISEIGKNGQSQYYINASFPYKSEAGFFEDDRVRMRKSNLRKSDKIRLLEEYLCFYRNDKLSNRMYSQVYGRTENRIKISTEKLKFPIEIEALYSLTSYLFDDAVVISPIILNKHTGKNCNFNRKDMDTVYLLYKKWFKKMKKGEFSNLTWPLKNSDYIWLGEDDVNNIESLIRRDL
ncbi:hypothetical protein D7322_15895 [Sphingobacterium puteale]|uniref:Lipoprotein n=1 Tax=Sphingobacterium puteale TaxID=2420510 RepID=A0A420VWM9_9SPHI|nr:hypothetical protein [Sphingobacterium puteale]RKO70751.1 hypothetical protein D7322_15895 [Sphingobacterium puteale]